MLKGGRLGSTVINIKECQNAPWPAHSACRRMGIDWGSGSLRFQVVDIDVKTNTIQKRLCSASITGPNWYLSEDLASHGGSFSQVIMDHTIYVLTHLQRFVLPSLSSLSKDKLSNLNISGVGTAAFRKAINGQIFLERVLEETGIPIALLPQDEEALIGFRTATNSPELSHLDEKCLLVWDCGNGSMQLAALNELTEGPLSQSSASALAFWGAPIGNHGALQVFKEVVLSRTRQQPLDANESIYPVTQQEVDMLITELQARMDPSPAWLRMRLQEGKQCLATCSGDWTIWGSFAMIDAKHRTANYNASDVYQALGLLVGQTEAQISAWCKNIEPPKQVGKLALLCAAMRHLGLTEVSHSFTPLGNTSGILTTESLW